MTAEENTTAKFAIGQLVEHQLFGYRGVIFEVDPCFMLSDAWYDQVARSRPPKDKPWYHVMPDNSTTTTYVAQQNLRLDQNHEPISHPFLEQVFAGFQDGTYLLPPRDIQ